MSLSIFGTNYGQSVVYNKEGKSKPITLEDINFEFDYDASRTLPQASSNESGGALASLIPVGLDYVFKAIGDQLEKNQQKFTAEYDAKQSNLRLNERTIPGFTYTRKVQIEEGNSLEPAFALKVKAHEIPDSPFAYFSIGSLEVNYSKAKTKAKANKLNYTIEIIPVFYVVDPKTNAITEKKVIKIDPISIPYVEFNNKNFPTTTDKLKYRSDFISLPKGSYLAEVRLKIVESNPAKVKAEKILELFNEFKDDARTVINNIIPEAESGAGNNRATPSPDQPVGNDN